MNFVMTFENFVKYQTIFNYRWLCQGLVALMLSAPLFVQAEIPQPGSPQDQVGEVSLVLGKAYIEGPNSGRQEIGAGYPVNVGDKIVTTANGHAHIRFVDDALVSVRPNSRLEVVLYDYDAVHPERSAVKFNLIEGVTRSISGTAAKAARQRFRLNTPIAAIGVRGTDFVVSATPDVVRALVNEGSIVMAPYSEGCALEALGPCGDNAVELSGESLEIVEFNTNNPEGAPATYQRSTRLLRSELQQLAVESADENQQSDAEQVAEGSEVYLEGVTSVRVTSEARILAEETPTPVPGADVDQVLDFTPPEPVIVEVLQDRQLIWGRWSWSEGQGDLERITVSNAEAKVGREITVSNVDYGLFRDPQEGATRVDAGLGVVGFKLNSAQAFYSSGSGIVAMQVKDGGLDIDFDRNTFSTELSLEHASTGLIDFNAMGRIYTGGYFYDRSATQNVVGAVSFDGTEAGYLFDRQLENGSIQGLTLWGSQ